MKEVRRARIVATMALVAMGVLLLAVKCEAAQIGTCWTETVPSIRESWTWTCGSRWGTTNARWLGRFPEIRWESER